jgi:hypothetical protein
MQSVVGNEMLLEKIVFSYRRILEVNQWENVFPPKCRFAKG